MAENSLETLTKALKSRERIPHEDAAIFPERGKLPAKPEKTTQPPTPAEVRLEAALREAGREGAERLRANGDIDLSQPFEFTYSSTTPYGGLVSRLINRRCAKAGLSVGAVMAAAGKSSATSIGGSAATAAGGAAIGASHSPGGVILPASFDQLLVLLVNRCTGSFDTDEYNLALSLGFTGYLNHHLNYLSIPDPEPGNFLAGDPTVTSTGDPTKGVFSNVADDSTFVLATTTLGGIPVSNDGWGQLLQATTLYRTILTKRTLHDRMTEFWTDHFNIDIRLVLQGYLKPVEDREVIRAHALDSFPALLTGDSESPAMLLYLDQWLSNYQAPNENYARELLELHAVGEGNGYTEMDVENVAKILAGRSVNGQGLYFFDTNLHDPASPAYSVLQNDPNPIAIPAGGKIQGDTLITELGKHQLTANHIAYKLCHFLYQENPPASLVSQVEAVYLNGTNPAGIGDIKEMIKTILTPANLTALLGTSPTTLKVKRPTQLVATFLRQCHGGPVWPGTVTDPLQPLRDRLNGLGHAPFWWGPPNGYPDAEGAWIGDLLGRWEILDSLTRNEVEDIYIDYVELVTILGAFTIPTTGFRMNEILSGGAMTGDEQFWIQEYVDIGVILLQLGLVGVEELIREIFAVAASAPSYQYY